ncbi:MAG: ABC transporter permease subunit [Miniphocaeibacter sp.]|uniref:ABC transporter permease n=1 Tax=Miniphocaeibacter sp. TaxID=3100973 RepID=UPI0017A5B275|nr:ABC transporter permease subunit [Gallicola sp.]
MKKNIRKIPLIIFGLYFITPIIGTILYSTSTKWDNSILPKDFTLKWFLELFKDTAFIQAVTRSFILGLITSIVILIIMIPTLILVRLYFPRVDRILQSIVLLPYAIPGVILVTALLGTYSKLNIPMFIVLVGALFITLLPITYLGINNQLKLINIGEMIDAASTLGASMVQTVIKIIIPNIKLGTTLVFLMVFSASFGEYMLTNLLIGGRFETIRIYMMRRMNENGHLASAVMILYFIFLLIVAIFVFIINNKQKKRHIEKSKIEEVNKQKLYERKEGLENVFNS